MTRLFNASQLWKLSSTVLMSPWTPIIWQIKTCWGVYIYIYRALRVGDLRGVEHDSNLKNISAAIAQITLKLYFKTMVFSAGFPTSLGPNISWSIHFRFFDGVHFKFTLSKINHMLGTWKYAWDGNEDVFFHCICSCTLDYGLWTLPLFLSIKQLHKVNFLIRWSNQQVFILLFISVGKSNKIC